jgi:hypothetical protein
VLLAQGHLALTQDPTVVNIAWVTNNSSAPMVRVPSSPKLHAPSVHLPPRSARACPPSQVSRACRRSGACMPSCFRAQRLHAPSAASIAPFGWA